MSFQRLLIRSNLSAGVKGACSSNSWSHSNQLSDRFELIRVVVKVIQHSAEGSPGSMCDTCFIWFILNGSEEHQTQEFTICLERSNPDPCQRILEKLRTSQVGPGKRAWKFKLSHHDLSKTWKNKPSGGKTKENKQQTRRIL